MQANMQYYNQSVSQAGIHACMQPGMHTYTERKRDPHTYRHTETYIEGYIQRQRYLARDRET